MQKKRRRSQTKRHPRGAFANGKCTPWLANQTIVNKLWDSAKSMPTLEERCMGLLSAKTSKWWGGQERGRSFKLDNVKVSLAIFLEPSTSFPAATGFSLKD